MLLYTQHGVSSINTLYVGSTIGVRWTSAGSIDLLAVGMIRVNQDGTIYDEEYPYPFYVGTSLASDECECDTVNTTSYDPCYESLSCNDFTFKIPNDIITGYYQLIIRFNNEFNIKSDILTIICNENNCNSTGHGYCGNDGKCICDYGWSGDSCDYSVCDKWEFAICSINDCGSIIGSGNIKPKCFSSDCDSSINITYFEANDNQCLTSENEYECSDPHYEGSYCEIPVDYCSTLLNTNCTVDDLCEFSNVANACVYSDCNIFTTKEECEGNYTIYDNQWSIFCQWIDVGGNGYCNRVTCGGGLIIARLCKWRS